MKYNKFIIIAAFLTAFAGVVQAGSKKTKVFLYGFAASFNDSTVYFTDIQAIDTATVQTRTKFLYGRDNYSYQLRDYLKEHGCATPTCITVFALKQKNIEKKYINLKKKYTGKNYVVKHITSSEFKYVPVVYEDDDAPEVDKKAEKAKAKQAKAARKQQREGAMPPPPTGGGQRPM